MKFNQRLALLSTTPGDAIRPAPSIGLAGGRRPRPGEVPMVEVEYPNVPPAPARFADRFHRAARGYLATARRARRAAVALDRLPADASPALRAHAEMVADRTMFRHLDAESAVAGLVRGLTAGKAVEVLAFGGYSRCSRSFATVEAAGYVFTVDAETGESVIAWPAGLRVRLDGGADAANDLPTG